MALVLALSWNGWMAPPHAQGARGDGPTDPKELEAFLETLFAEQMEESKIPGAVFVLVKDGKVFFARGYGYANLETKKPVDPEKTLFYLASVTKSFTATAVLQLVEQERLDLNADVNRYLRRFQLPVTYPEPVTLRHLLTHTAGFDDKNIGYVARTAAEALPLGDYLARALPPQVRPPGQVNSYSNHGYGLAGHIVELVSGVPYAQYVEENILRPLGMRHSTASIPLPPVVAVELAVGYGVDFRSGRLVPLPLGYRNIPPAGTISASGMDMGRFLLAHLENGAYGEEHILTDETVREMHRQQVTHHPQLPGFAFGFYERFENNLRSVEHAGGYLGYSSLLLLLPEQRTGFFLAYNRMTGSLSERLVREFFDHYYPVATEANAPPQPPADFLTRARRFVGSYHWTRYSRRSVEKIALWDTYRRLSISTEGVLVIQPVRGEASRWVEVEPLLFRQVDGENYMAFREDESGRITYMFTSLFGGGVPVALEKLSWRDDPAVQRWLLVGLLGVFFSACTLWPLAILAGRWWRRWRKLPPPLVPRRARLLAGMNCALLVVFFLGVDALIGNSGYRLQLVYGMTGEMKALLAIPLVTAALTIAVSIIAVQAWRRGHWSLAGRVYYSLLILAALLVIPFLLNWNLLGFRY